MNQRPDGLQQFEVAAIRRSDPTANSPIVHATQDGLRITAADLKTLIGFAYGPFAPGTNGILGGSGWMSTMRFDVNARIEAAELERFRALGTDERELRLRKMMQELLRERFQLVLHSETRQISSYELVATDRVKLRPGLPDDPTLPNGTLQMENEVMTGKGVTVSRLASLLGQVLRQPVANHTSLDGRYDFSLNWQREPGEPPDDKQSTDATLLTALREQLGLQLKPAKMETKIVVIDHAGQPSDN